MARLRKQLPAHAGEAELKLENGSAFRITLIGHSAGSDVAYFEMRV